MRSGEVKEKIFQELVQIKDKVRKQYPFIINRFDDLECIPLDPNLEEKEQQQIIQAAQIKYDDNTKAFEVARRLHTIYKYLNDLFATYLQDQGIASATELTQQQKLAFKRMLPLHAETLHQKVQRQKKLTPEISSPDIEFLSDLLQQQSDQLAETLFKGEKLKLSNADFAKRFDLWDELTELRERHNQQMWQNIQIASLCDENVGNKLNKLYFLGDALFALKENARVALCGELVSLSIYYFIKNDLFRFDKKLTIEVATCDYMDANGKQEDNHVFFAINRDPTSDLSDFSSWGDDAVLFDPWNDLLCYAIEYKKLNCCYLTYSTGTNWDIYATYDHDDCNLLNSLTLQDRDYYMTGNNLRVNRIPLLMDEFKLLPLSQPDDKEISDYLYKLSQVMRPANFHYQPELFLTTESKEVISVIPGFAEPKIAIHHHFFQFTEEELRFAMARALLTVQRNWAGMTQCLAAEEQFKINQLAIEKCQNGAAAVSFLRKSVKFEKQMQITREEPYPLTFNYLIPTEVDDQIKALMTLFAADEYQYLNTSQKEAMQTPVPSSIANKMLSLPVRNFFGEGFARCTDEIAKINYLISCLPELKKELMPYELYGPSARVREFCYLINTIQFNINDIKQNEALHEFIHKAFEWRVPGFREIYFAIHGVEVDDVKGVLQTFGPFRELQRAITAFIESSTQNDAINTAIQIEQWFHKLKTHFNHYYNVNSHSTFKQFGEGYTNGFEQAHGRPPQGNDRYFGSDIGNHIIWRGFIANDSNHLPWVKLVGFAKTNKEVAEVLWKLGVHRYQPLWDVMDPERLLALHKNSKQVFIRVSGILHDRYSYNAKPDTHFINILHYLKGKCQFNSDVWYEESTFKNRLHRFYQTYKYMLIFPQLTPIITKENEEIHLNDDNEAVRFLLHQFGEIALSGTAEEKQLVKEFFTDPTMEPGLWQLRSVEVERGELPFESPYIQFLLNQTHKGVKFDLFTTRELRELFYSENNYRRYASYYFFPLPTILTLYELPYKSLTLECLEAFIALIKNKSFHFENAFLLVNKYAHQNKHEAFSTQTMRLVPIIRSTASSWLYSENLVWNVFDVLEELPGMSLQNVIYLYRYYDNKLLFPDIKTKQSIGNVIFKEIMLLEDIKDQMAALEALLLIDDFVFPLSDMSLRDRVIQQWAKNIGIIYGKDTGEQDYYDILFPIIKRFLDCTSSRDQEALFEKLAVSIESQWKISEYLGEHLEKEKYFRLKQNEQGNGIDKLAIASKFFSETTEDQQHFLDFISSPLTDQSLRGFEKYLQNHPRKTALSQQITNLEPDTWHTLYFVFWGCSLEKRAVLIDHVIIPASKVKTPSSTRKAYEQGFDYIAHKLFPDADNPSSDDHFAYSIMRAYLEISDKNIRGILLSGMLVATNEVNQANQVVSVGKKIALMCEHMGPAYIKLAQAIHSHPDTPLQLRRDLDHIKGRANPPYRWQLWRLIKETLPKPVQNNVKRIGKLLGSASYNLALEAIYEDNTNGFANHCVLLLLRENARHDAETGFNHLDETVNTCDHPRMISSREAASSTISESRKLSVIEMDKTLSEQQYQIANTIYKDINKEIDGFSLSMRPVKLFSNGDGYRFIERVYGKEFNDLPDITPWDKRVRHAVASLVVETEFANILSGHHFDSDRHGNQLRVLIDKENKKIDIGLYDFGEMLLELPDEVEVKRLANLISEIPRCLLRGSSVNSTFNELLSDHINKAKINGEPTRYLRRVRKAFLALQDFMKVLPDNELIPIIKNIAKNEFVNADIRKSIDEAMPGDLTLSFYRSVNSFMSWLRSDTKPKDHSAAPKPALNYKGQASS